MSLRYAVIFEEAENNWAAYVNQKNRRKLRNVRLRSSSI